MLAKVASVKLHAGLSTEICAPNHGSGDLDLSPPIACVAIVAGPNTQKGVKFAFEPSTCRHQPRGGWSSCIKMTQESEVFEEKCEYKKRKASEEQSLPWASKRLNQDTQAEPGKKLKLPAIAFPERVCETLLRMRAANLYFSPLPRKSATARSNSESSTTTTSVRA